ncbi:MAG: glycosyltransferase family 4 protein [Nanoarchaeota archaeon]|nr:glycosyltransferase family 4 protein [Nanoarchaeota archaeon]
MKNLMFISRKFPPSVGGMQKQNYELYQELTKYFNVNLTAMGKNQGNLLWFFPYAFLKSLFISKKMNVVLLGDGVLSPIGYLIKKIFNKRVYCVIHGLDVTYDNSLYQYFILNFLRKIDGLICVSNNTIDECVKRGISRDKCFFVPNGIYSEESINYSKEESRRKIENKFGINLKDKKILITIGRLRKRKGVYWFLTNVLDKIKEDIIYLVIGSGSEEKRIKPFIGDKSILLKNVTEEDKKHIYNISDIFIMPNIAVKGDVEGFGIVAIEAAIRGIPVIASNMEGIKDAIFDNKNGFLVETKNAEEFVKKIKETFEIKNLENFKKKQIEFTKEKFEWKKIGEEYYKILK